MDRSVSHVVVLLPFIIVIIYHSWFFMMRAYVTAEGSIDPGGLPHRWIIKSVLVLSFVLFGIATWLDQSPLLQNSEN